jgi:hypothetical protein
MEIDLAALPDDVEALHHLIGDLIAAREHERAEARAEIERLHHIVKLLQRNRFGRRSERLCCLVWKMSIPISPAPKPACPNLRRQGQR